MWNDDGVTLTKVFQEMYTFNGFLNLPTYAHKFKGFLGEFVGGNMNLYKKQLEFGPYSTFKPFHPYLFSQGEWFICKVLCF